MAHTNMINYNKIKYETTVLMNKLKNESWEKFVNTINSRNTATQVYDKLRKLKGSRKSNDIISLINQNNETITNIVEISETLASTFENLTNKYDTNILNTTQIYIPTDNQNTLEYNKPITLVELKLVLSDCKGSSPGPDGIHYDMIKNLTNDGHKILLELYNKIWMSGRLPKEWKTSTIIPIKKPGKDQRYATNYRPISLTNCLCKLLERIINSRLKWLLETHNVFGTHQSAFRQYRSTLDNLSYLENEIVTNFTLQNHTIAVFFDMDKAYDRVHPNLIINSLIDLGIKGNLIRFIADFLSERHFKVSVNAHQSSKRKMKTGIPQGSVLSCQLFLVAIKNLFTESNIDIKFAIYADDIVLFCSGKEIETLKVKMQRNIDKLFKSAHKFGFKFSESKTKAMLFTRRRKNIYEPKLMLGKNEIIYTKEQKFLGMIFDNKLSWNKHITHTKAKATQNLNLIKMLRNNKYGSDRKMLIRIFNSVVLPVIDYGCILYETANKSSLSTLDTILNTGIRMAIGAFRTSPINSIMSDSGTLPLKYRRDQIKLNYGLKIMSSQTHLLTDKITNVTNENKMTKMTKRYHSITYRIKHCM